MPQIILITGVSGAGKSTLLEFLFKKYSDNLFIPISSTTRSLKERDKKSFKKYEYLSKGDFQKRVQDDYFLEHEEVHGNHYGTPKNCLRIAHFSNKDLILDIDPQGAINILSQKVLDYEFKPVGIFVWRDIDPLIDFPISRLIDSVKANLIDRDGASSPDIRERARTAINDYFLARKYQNLFNFVENDGKTDNYFKKIRHIYVPTFFPAWFAFFRV